MGMLEALQKFKAANPGLRLTPGLSEPELSQIESTLGAKLPADFRELASLCSGIDDGAFYIDFTTKEHEIETSDLCPFPLAIAADGVGNFWVIDVRKDVEEPSQIYFWCHDPPVFLFQCSGMDTWLRELTTYEQTESGPIQEVLSDSKFDVWGKDPEGLSVQDALTSSDPVLRDFAAQLGETFRIVDLRSAPRGLGVAWGRYYAGVTLKRFNAERIFAYQPIEKKPGLLGRLFGRK